MPIRKPHSPLAVLATTGMLAVAGGEARAAGFQLTEQSVTGLGRAFAGAGVVGDDLSSVVFNPAGMTLLSGAQAQAGLTAVLIDGKIKGSSTRQGTFTGGPFAGRPIPGFSAVESGSGDGGAEGYVPNVFFVTEINDRLRLGLGINGLFGLKTDYPDDWFGRYHARLSDVKTIDINPSLAWRIDEHWSLGAGLSAQYIEATLSQSVFNPLDQANDGTAKVDGDDWNYGWNLGVMYELSRDTRFGLSYRSGIDQELDGDLKISGLSGAAAANNGKSEAKAEVDLPATVYLSGYHRLNPRWALTGGVRWTDWSKFQELRIQSVGRPDSVTDEDWKDNWRFALGVEHYYSPAWTLRAGLAYDTTVIRDDEHRTPRIPDGDRTWLSFGGSYRPQKNLSVDFGYTHIFVREGDLDNTVNIAALRTPAGPVVVSDRLVGELDDAGADLFGVQVQYRF